MLAYKSKVNERRRLWKKKEEKIAMVVLPFLLYNSFIIKFSVYLSGTRIFKVEWKEVEFLRGLGTFSGTSCTLLRSFWRIYDSCKKEVEYSIYPKGAPRLLYLKKKSHFSTFRSNQSVDYVKTENHKSFDCWFCIQKGGSSIFNNPTFKSTHVTRSLRTFLPVLRSSL